MSLWVDRRDAIPVRAPATHALVIGVSAYENLPARHEGPDDDPLKLGLVNLASPAIGAFRFACWLRDTFHHPAKPLATIDLLLSPSADEMDEDQRLADTMSTVRRSTTEVVRKAILRWKRRCRGVPDGMAVLYASGHGASSEASFVLLEDFAADENVFDYAIDVDRVVAGMSGPQMAQTQVYFIDACRVRPQAFNQYGDAGTGIGLLREWHGPDDRVAAIYRSALPYGPAFGDSGRGTVFSRALLDCLASLGAQDCTDEAGRWRITTHSLLEALNARVRRLAETYGVCQDVVPGGVFRPAMLHYFTEPPAFPLTIEVAPEEATEIAWASLWDQDHASRLLDRAGFDANPMTWIVPGGLYTLDVDVDPPRPGFRCAPGLAVAVPRRAPGPRRVDLS
jgi:hypothetical protein